MNDPSYYPTDVCHACKDHVQTTIVLKSTYENTNQYLKSYFIQNETIQGNDVPKIETTDNEPQIDVKVENVDDLNCYDPLSDREIVHNVKETVSKLVVSTNRMTRTISNSTSSRSEITEGSMNIDTARRINNAKQKQSNDRKQTGKTSESSETARRINNSEQKQSNDRQQTGKTSESSDTARRINNAEQKQSNDRKQTGRTSEYSDIARRINNAKQKQSNDRKQTGKTSESSDTARRINNAEQKQSNDGKQAGKTSESSDTARRINNAEQKQSNDRKQTEKTSEYIDTARRINNTEQKQSNDGKQARKTSESTDTARKINIFEQKQLNDRKETEKTSESSDSEEGIADEAAAETINTISLVQNEEDCRKHADKVCEEIMSKKQERQKHSSKAEKAESNSIDTEKGYSTFKFSTNHTSMKLLGIPLSQQTYLCPVCRKEFSKPPELRQHAYKHKILRKHMSTHLKVPQNAKFFASPRQTDTLYNKNEILHKCVFCDADNPTAKFRDHVANHLKQKEFSCSKCCRVFRKLGHLKTHMTLAHLKELPYQCDRCDKQFSAKYTYESHSLTHRNSTSDLPFKCDFCDKSFPNKTYLYRHILRHTQQKNCHRCLSTFETFDKLREHVQSEFKCEQVNRVRKPTVFTCDVCPRTYEKFASFMTHKYSHGEKVLCELCGTKVRDIKQHMRSHAPKQDPLECQVCQKKLASKLTLTKHLRIHTGEKPYPCKYCDKRFRDLYNKTVHERVHVGVRKHVCPVCGKGFLEKSYMVKHLRGVHKHCSPFPIEKGKAGRPAATWENKQQADGKCFNDANDV